MKKRIQKNNRMLIRFEHHLRKHLITGLLLLLPIGITLTILKVLFNITAGLLMPVFRRLFGELPNSLLLIVSFVTFVVMIYVCGRITTHVVGRRLVSLGEYIIMQVPLLKTIYGASKQVVETFALSNHQTFTSVVLLEFPRRGVRSLGFITGTIDDEEGQRCYKVFVPTTPNPTSGFFLIVTPDEIQQTSFSVEDGIKMIVSGGILSPTHLDKVGRHKQSPGKSFQQFEEASEMQ